MRVRSILAISVFACLAMLPAKAQEHVILLGAGVSTCGGFAERYRVNPDSEFYYLSWAQGVWSALNAASLQQEHVYRDLAAISVDTQRVMLRNYCDMHPLEHFALAASDVYMRFPEMPYDTARDTDPGLHLGRPMPQRGQSAPGR